MVLKRQIYKTNTTCDTMREYNGVQMEFWLETRETSQIVTLLEATWGCGSSSKRIPQGVKWHV